MENPLLASALDYAQRGWRVLPLFWLAPADGGALACGCGRADCSSPGKHPLASCVPKGSKDATSNVDLIRRWWTVHPRANVGIATGEAGGLVVVDVDPRHGGVESFNALGRQMPGITNTLRVRTGSGGGHLYYHHPGFPVANSAGRLGPGLDVRGEGGYVVAPPSTHVSGGVYGWVEKGPQEPAPLPALPNLVEMTAPDGARLSASGAPRVVGQTIPYGTIHTTLVSVAGSMRRRGCEEEEIYAALSVMARRAERPITDGHLRQIASSMMRYEPAEATGIRAEDVEQAGEDAPFTHISDLMRDMIRFAESVKGTGGVPGLSTGLSAYDQMTGGLMPAEMTIIGARPSMGKSTLAFQWMTHAAGQDVPVLLYSAEMSGLMVAQRAATNRSGVDGLALRTGRLTDAEHEALNAAAFDLSALPIHVCDRGGMTIESLSRYAERHLDSGQQIGLVMVDYLQLVRAGEKTATRDEEIVAAVSRGLKDLAKSLRVPVVALAQLNRDVEKRSGGSKEPGLSDLRQSGQIEQDADVVAFLHRPIKYGITTETVEGRETDTEHYARLIIAKQRMGPLGSVHLHFDGAAALFADWNPITHTYRPNAATPF